MSDNKHLDAFLTLRAERAPNSIKSLRDVASEFVNNPKFLKSHDFTKHSTSILIGHVQSGKTGHYLAIVAAVADAEPNFPVFVILTQNSVPLQQQTLAEARALLPTFDVFDEVGDVDFLKSLGTATPKMLVLKKEGRVLRKWNHIFTAKLLGGRSLFIVDDEADATGLNTAVNKGLQSEINRQLEALIVPHRSFFLQVTATPQAVFLQGKNSTFRPKTHIFFPPGKDYLGGDFFFPNTFDPSKPPFNHIATEGMELVDLLDANRTELPKGLRLALHSYLITAAYRIRVEKDDGCSFLLHPSINKLDHSLISSKVSAYLQNIRANLGALTTNEDFIKAYADLKSSKPQLPDIDTIIRLIGLTTPVISVLNSARGNLVRSIPKSGANIFIGGNVLSRGIVLPRLQTTYYCRSAKRINLDTYWQHSRAFGYDRDAALIRVFMPPQIYSMFCQLNESVSRLFNALANNSTDEITVLTPKGTRATRSNVVNQLDTSTILGGVSYFADDPDQKNLTTASSALSAYSEVEEFHKITIEQAIPIFKSFGDMHLGVAEASQFISALQMLETTENCILIVRKGRRISRNTGSLISPNDRELMSRFPRSTVLIAYELTGEKQLGWDGDAFWIPNIKLPNHLGFHAKQ
ncbi:Z1 domain-containing protein [Microbacteriaceae bacterium MWH-Ta3]|nr:Z1 domain-containing protein [Microbacteriaceae bacterium MWH-Ta3]